MRWRLSACRNSRSPSAISTRTFNPYTLFDQPPPPPVGQPLLHAAQRDHGRRVVDLGASTGSAAGRGATCRPNQMVVGRRRRIYEDECFILDLRFFRRYTSFNGDNGSTTAADPDDLQDDRTVRLQGALTDQETDVMAHATSALVSRRCGLAGAGATGRGTLPRRRRAGRRRGGAGDADRGRGERRRDQQRRCRATARGCSRCPPACR